MSEHIDLSSLVYDGLTPPSASYRGSGQADELSIAGQQTLNEWIDQRDKDAALITPADVEQAERALAATPCIPCRCGTYSDELNRYVWIESPRTGKRITLSGGYSQEIGRGVIERISLAQDAGQPTALFSRDELMRFIAIDQRIGGGNGNGKRVYRRRFSRSWSR
jgi:hypothetical protein